MLGMRTTASKERKGLKENELGEREAAILPASPTPQEGIPDSTAMSSSLGCKEGSACVTKK